MSNIATEYTTVDQFEEKLDMLKLYFNNDFPITDKITIHKPTIQEIVDYDGGEDLFFFMLHVFVGNTTYFRVALWDNGIDWNKISDFEMWYSMVSGFQKQQTEILFGDLDFSKFKPIEIENDVTNNDDSKKSFIIYDSINDIEINEITYFRMRNYLRYMFGIFPSVEVGVTGKRLKQRIIDIDRNNAAANSKKNSGSFLFPMISSCLNHPGFKYNKEQLREVGIVEFMDSVQRIQVYEQATATLKGMMSGFADSTKIKPEQYNFMKEISLKPKSKEEQIRECISNSQKLDD